MQNTKTVLELEHTLRFEFRDVNRKSEELNESDVDIYVWITDYEDCDEDGLCDIGIAPTLGSACDLRLKNSINSGPSLGLMKTVEVIYNPKAVLNILIRSNFIYYNLL